MKKTFVLIIAILFSMNCFAGTEDLYPNYDLAPGVVPQNVPQTDPMWDLQYEYSIEAACGDNGLLGIEYNWVTNEIWISGRGASMPNQIYRVHPTSGEYLGMFPTSTNSSWGVRDMCDDGTFIYGGEDSGLLCLDPVTQSYVETLSWPAGMQFPRANTYDPATDHFYCGNFSSDCYEMDRQGNLIRSWSPAPLTAIYGMAWDDTAPDGPWLWVIDQINPSSGCNFHKFDPVTLTYTGYVIQLNHPGGSLISGGGEHVYGIDPVHTSFLSFGQGTPDWGGAWEGYLVANPLAPSCPAEFIVENNGLALTASLSWVNPEFTVSGVPLTDLDGVEVYRDGVVIADLTNMGIGEPASYEDNDISQPGMCSYTVRPYNQYGSGTPASAGAWIGLDVPGVPQNVEAIPDPNMTLETTITWEPPIEGAHGAYFPPGSWDGQRIYRDGILIADLSGTNTVYIDNPSLAGFFEYGVSYYNSSGEGEISPTPAVYVGPICFEPIPYEWIDISVTGTNTGLAADDAIAGPFDIGFAFPYYDGQICTQMWVSTNGWASFTETTQPAYTNSVIPSPSLPNNILAPYWDDMNLDPSSGGGSIYYEYDNVNNRFIMMWLDCQHYGTGGSYSFELIIYPDGTIDFMYADLTPGTALSATVGVENSLGTEGVLCSYNGSGPLEPAAGTGIRIQLNPVIPPPPNIEISLTPIGSTTIPANGGILNFDIEVGNTEPMQVNVDIWTTVTLPNSTVYGPIINVNRTFNALQVVERNRNQNVPASAPEGDYTYYGYIGIYPSMIFDEDHFDFEKTALDNDGQVYNDWSNWGEDFGELDESAEVVETFELHEPYPNPFNPETQLTFSLPSPGEVSLIIYDIAGRETAVLVDGIMPGGINSLKWNASDMPSGIYFARLDYLPGAETRQHSSVKKLVLLK